MVLPAISQLGTALAAPERPNVITIVLQLLPKNHVKDIFGRQCQMEPPKGNLSFEDKVQEMTSAWRVISFFIVVFVVPTILISVPLYARYQLYHTRYLYLSDGDIMALHDTVSSFWCQGQKISSNGSFNAYLTDEERLSRKERRTSSMRGRIPLQFDEAEEWGFYLVGGSHVRFTACARWPGASLIVVQGETNMKKCFYREKKTLEELLRPITTGFKFASHSSPPLSEVSANFNDENNGGEVTNGDPEMARLDSDLPLVRLHDVGKTNLPIVSKRPARNRRNSDISEKFLDLESKLNEQEKEKLSDILRVRVSPDKKISREPKSQILSEFDSKTRKFTTIPKLSVSEILSNFNDTRDITYGNSSFSSSEEFMSHCISTIFSLDLSPYIDCPSEESKKREKFEFLVNESDYYFFLFSSDNSIEVNVIDFQVNLSRALYDLGEVKQQCSNVSECVFPFSFLGKGGAVVDFEEKTDQVTRLQDLNTYELTSYCQPRSIVYTVLILLVPFIIVLFAFR